MRSHWDASEARAREAVTAAGVQINAVDVDAFRTATADVLANHRTHPEVAPLVDRIEAEAKA
jgi:TRAP-type C4-dicarboxylate transport system substrate-binding protein